MSVAKNETLPSVTPSLIIKGASEAIAFYVKAFGAEELCRMSCPETGKIMHAAVKIGDSRLFLADECPDWGALGPQAIGGSPVTLHLYVDDVDAVFDRAVEAGAAVKMPVDNMFWGDRYGKLADPFGHQWSIATHVEDLTPEQMQERMQAFFAAAATS